MDFILCRSFYTKRRFVPEQMLNYTIENKIPIEINGITILALSSHHLPTYKSPLNGTYKATGYMYFSDKLFHYLPYILHDYGEIQRTPLDFSLTNPYLAALKSVDWQKDILDFKKNLLLG